MTLTQEAASTDYEQAQQQALAFLDAPPFMLSGRYWSRDPLYD